MTCSEALLYVFSCVWCSSVVVVVVVVVVVDAVVCHGKQVFGRYLLPEG
jgi:hypothetical protein